MFSARQACNWFKYFPRSSLKLPHCLATTTRTNSTIEKVKYGAIVTKANTSKPLVVILGWNDCRVKHLQKYSELFENKDWSTICLPTNSFNTFLRSGSKVKTISFYIIDLIKDLTAEKGNPVVLYSFSNGGCAVYFHLMEALTTAGQQNFNAFKVVGSIFDSCPVKPSMETIQEVQISVTERIRNPVIRSLVWYTLGILIPIRVKSSKTVKRFFKDLGNMPLRGPELFLYSKGDNLASYEGIEEHIACRKSQGVNVIDKCWEDSTHVTHYMKYPKEYIELLENFLEICLKKD